MFATRKLMLAGLGPLKVDPTPTNQSTGSSTLTLNKPAGVVAGDLQIALGLRISMSGTWTPHASFTERLDSIGLMLATMNAGGSEPANYGFTSGSSYGTIMRVARAVYDAVGALSSASGTPAAPSITMTGAGLLLAVFVDPSIRTFTTPAGMSPVFAYNNGPTYAIFEQMVGAGATGTRTSTVSSGSAAQGVLIGAKYA